MSCFLLHGNVGTGKTAITTGLVLLNLDSGRDQAVNWDVECPEGVRFVDLRGKTFQEAKVPKIGGVTLYRYDDLPDMFGVEDCDIYTDEAQNTMGARDWESMPKSTRRWLSEHRHWGCNLIFLTQHYKFVDVYFRRLADHVWEVWRLFHLSFMSPCPEADPETGEPGRSEFLKLRAIK